MAANFWLSSHCNQWMLDVDEIMIGRQQDLQFLTEVEYQKVHIFYSNFMQSLGEHLDLRQQVIATATVFFKRFYSKNSLKSIDPLLIAPTCVYLASKVEECGAISNNKLISACSSVVKNKYSYAFQMEQFPYRMNQVLECEFYLLEMLDCCLIIYHPYRPLTQYVSDLGMEEAILPTAWRIINDSLRTDIFLIYPPYLIALAAIHMACVIQQKDSKQWFAELSVDMDQIVEITHHILRLYEIWKNFEEKQEIRGILNKAPKPKVRPSSTTPGHTPSPITTVDT
ncbi:cyclin-C [Nematostella vectensis]|uniref:cyclin-C n=1 Tax=Nematostella vectensis TaxID=45351 RepID=UPI0020776799|nr:cyclin-C [Nematostella vectensis]